MTAWLAAVPPTPPPACHGTALHVDLELQGATGSLVGVVTVSNDGQRCSLSGRLYLTLTGASNRGGVRTTALRPEPRPRVLPTGAVATARVRWSNWCGREPRALVATVAGADFRLALLASPRCDSRSRPSLLAVGPFT